MDVISSRLVEGSAINRGASSPATHLSELRASALDPDQTAVSGSLDSITIKAGQGDCGSHACRAAATQPTPTQRPGEAGRTWHQGKPLLAYGKIGALSVNSISPGVFGSAFLLNSDPWGGVAGIQANSLGQKRGPGLISAITIESTSLFGNHPSLGSPVYAGGF